MKMFLHHFAWSLLAWEQSYLDWPWCIWAYENPNTLYICYSIKPIIVSVRRDYEQRCKLYYKANTNRICMCRYVCNWHSIASGRAGFYKWCLHCKRVGPRTPFLPLQGQRSFISVCQRCERSLSSYRSSDGFVLSIILLYHNTAFLSCHI